MSTNPTPPDLIDDLKSLVDACGSRVSDNDKAIVAIELCISRGVDTENHIVGSLMRAGFRNDLAGAVLKGNCGPAPNAHRWRQGADGRYSLHDDDVAPPA
jgi:hypothetical protein